MNENNGLNNFPGNIETALDSKEQLNNFLDEWKKIGCKSLSSLQLGNLFFEAVRKENIDAVQIIYDLAKEKYDYPHLIGIIHGEYKDDTIDSFTSFKAACRSKNPKILEFIIGLDLHKDYQYLPYIMLKSNEYEGFNTAVCDGNVPNIIQLLDLAKSLDVQFNKKVNDEKNFKRKTKDVLLEMIKNFQGIIENKFCNLLLFNLQAFKIIFDHVAPSIQEYIIKNISEEFPKFADNKRFNKKMSMVDIYKIRGLELSEEDFNSIMMKAFKDLYIILQPFHINLLLNQKFIEGIFTTSASHIGLRGGMYSITNEKGAKDIIDKSKFNEIEKENELKLYNKNKPKLSILETAFEYKLAYNWYWHLNQISELFLVCKNPLLKLGNSIGCVDIICNIMYFLNDERLTPRIDLMCNVLDKYNTSFNEKSFVKLLKQEKCLFESEEVKNNLSNIK